jgi:hypothetical protein
MKNDLCSLVRYIYLENFRKSVVQGMIVFFYFIIPERRKRTADKPDRQQADKACADLQPYSLCRFFIYILCPLIIDCYRLLLHLNGRYSEYVFYKIL